MLYFGFRYGKRGGYAQGGFTMQIPIDHYARLSTEATHVLHLFKSFQLQTHHYPHSSTLFYSRTVQLLAEQSSFCFHCIQSLFTLDDLQRSQCSSTAYRMPPESGNMP